MNCILLITTALRRTRMTEATGLGTFLTSFIDRLNLILRWAIGCETRLTTILSTVLVVLKAEITLRSSFLQHSLPQDWPTSNYINQYYKPLCISPWPSWAHFIAEQIGLWILLEAFVETACRLVLTDTETQYTARLDKGVESLKSKR